MSYFSPMISEDPMCTKCPECGETILTKVKFKNVCLTYLSALGLLLICFPMFWIPFISPYCKEVMHECPKCGETIVVHPFMSLVP